jgi:DEAD/DEAH box helicase domain-containing protein
MDTIVFDIETQNFFTDPEVGWDNFAALKISAVGVYSYLYDRYWCFEESEIEKVAEIFDGSRCIVGFSINRYDVPVLNNYFGKLPQGKRIDLWEKERIDLLEEIEMEAGQRIGLGKLAEVNLGIKKERHGSEAIGLYKRGEIEELKKYCLNDVRLTKELYDLYRHRKYFLLPDQRSGEIIKVNFGNQNVQTAHLF